MRSLATSYVIKNDDKQNVMLKYSAHPADPTSQIIISNTAINANKGYKQKLKANDDLSILL